MLLLAKMQMEKMNHPAQKTTIETLYLLATSRLVALQKPIALPLWPYYFGGNHGRHALDRIPTPKNMFNISIHTAATDFPQDLGV